MSSAAPPLSTFSDAPAPRPAPPDGIAPVAHGAAPTARSSLAGRLAALLPQTQCTRCGYPDCHAYAQALADGQTTHDRCPPGGEEGVRRLAAALGRPPGPLADDVGTEAPRQRVFIDEDRCIGCTLCIQACPVDVIIGAPKRMHAVIEPLCTGCELCLPACPVDCIVRENASGAATGWNAWTPAQADESLARYEARAARLARASRSTSERLARRSPGSVPAQPPVPTPAAAPPVAAADPRRAAIEAALARARARLGPG